MNTVIYTERVEYIASYCERRDAIDQNVPKFIRACGYIPVAIPNIPSMVDDFVEKINPAGIIFTGGNSLVRYGGDAPERDETEKRLLGTAIKKNIPVYGFCRGMQIILDYFDNNLVNVKNHVAKRHMLFGSLHGEVVNSYHNQGCMKLKEHSKMQVLAYTEDGVIEAIQHEKYKILATMWHPERETPFQEKDIQRVKKLIEE